MTFIVNPKKDQFIEKTVVTRFGGERPPRRSQRNTIDKGE